MVSFEAAQAAHERRREQTARHIERSSIAPPKPERFKMYQTPKNGEGYPALLQKNARILSGYFANIGHLRSIDFHINKRATSRIHEFASRADSVFFPAELRDTLLTEYKRAARNLGVNLNAIPATEDPADPDAKRKPSVDKIHETLAARAEELRTGIVRAAKEVAGNMKKFVEDDTARQMLPIFEELKGAEFLTFSDSTGASKDSERMHISPANIAAAALQLEAHQESLRALSDPEAAATIDGPRKEFIHAVPVIKRAMAEAQLIIDELSAKRLSALRREVSAMHQKATAGLRGLPRGEKKAAREKLKADRDGWNAKLAGLRTLRQKMVTLRKTLTPLAQSVRNLNRKARTASPRLKRADKALENADALRVLPGQVKKVVAEQEAHLKRLMDLRETDLEHLSEGGRLGVKFRQEALLSLVANVRKGWEEFEKNSILEPEVAEEEELREAA